MTTATPQNIGKYLEQIALNKTIIHYGELASEFGLPLVTDAWLAHPLSQIFGVLDQEDANAGRPFRTSVVVSKNKTIPGNGFFEMLESLKDIKCRSPKQRDEEWMKELHAAYNYPWGD